MRKNKKILIILSLFFGFLGLDRFYVGDYFYGFLKCITFGGFGIWWLFDFIYVYSGLLDKN